MSGMFRLPDEAALDELLKRSHVRVVNGPYTAGPKAKPGPKPAPPKKGQKEPSSIEYLMGHQIQEAGLPEPVRQLQYFEDRKFTGDFCWPDRRIALEVDGGAHKTEGRFSASFERAYMLMMANWTVLHVGKTEVRNYKALEWITHVLARTRGTRDDDAKIMLALMKIEDFHEQQP